MESRIGVFRRVALLFAHSAGDGGVPLVPVDFRIPFTEMLHRVVTRDILCLKTGSCITT
jgi:hypothetical protein